MVNLNTYNYTEYLTRYWNKPRPIYPLLNEEDFYGLRRVIIARYFGWHLIALGKCWATAQGDMEYLEEAALTAWLWLQLEPAEPISGMY